MPPASDGYGMPLPGATPCFAAGTQVLVGYDGDGKAITRNIEDIEVGDTVLAREQSDPDAPIEAETVTDVEVHTVTSLRILEIEQADGGTETIRTTDGHPFWVKDVGWVPAGQLEVGEQFLSADGKLVTLTDTTSEDHPEGIRVYNLTIDRDHTFFVTDVAGDETVWVRNTDGPPDPDDPFKTHPAGAQKPATPSDSGWWSSFLLGLRDASGQQALNTYLPAAPGMMPETNPYASDYDVGGAMANPFMPPGMKQSDIDREHNAVLAGVQAGYSNLTPQQQGAYDSGQFAYAAAQVVVPLVEGWALSKFAAPKPAVPPARGTLSSVAARQWYLTQEKQIEGQIDAALPLRDRAIRAFNIRNGLRDEARALMADRAEAARLAAEEPNMTLRDIVRRKYQIKGLVGDALWQDILDSAPKSRSSLNKALGLE